MTHISTVALCSVNISKKSSKFKQRTFLILILLGNSTGTRCDVAIWKKYNTDL